jgi:hypothetical protein|tara:strand:+ start:97 stop:522 length:426 start_codon:yes stop_codon:yes gene_type:complete
MTVPVFIPKENIQKVFTVAKESIDTALKYSGNHYNIDDIFNSLLKGEMQLWVLWNPKRKINYQGCTITKILKRTNTTILNIFIVTGSNRKQWQDKISVLEDYAKKQGCTHIETYARPGWSRILKNKQYKITHYLLEKKLEE